MELGPDGRDTPIHSDSAGRKNRNVHEHPHASIIHCQFNLSRILDFAASLVKPMMCWSAKRAKGAMAAHGAKGAMAAAPGKRHRGGMPESLGQAARCAILCVALIQSIWFAAGAQEDLLKALPAIEYSAPDLFPEGITYDPEIDAFWVVPLGGGADVSTVDRSGTYTRVTNAILEGEIPSALASVLSVDYNAHDGLLYMTVSEFIGLSERTEIVRGRRVRDSIQTGVVAIDPRDPLSPRTYYNFTSLPLGFGGTVHYANDLISAPDGTVYVTDVGQVVALRPPSSGPENTGPVAEVFVSDPLLSGSFGGGEVGANGIAYLPSEDPGAQGFLLISNAGTCTLERVDLDSKAVTTVDFGPSGFDLCITGVTRLADGSMALSGRSPISAVTVINSTDSYITSYTASVTPVDPHRGIGTSTVDRNGTLYVSAGRIGPQAYDLEAPPVDGFAILPFDTAALVSDTSSASSGAENGPEACNASSPDGCEGAATAAPDDDTSGAGAILLAARTWTSLAALSSAAAGAYMTFILI